MRLKSQVVIFKGLHNFIEFYHILVFCIYKESVRETNETRMLSYFKFYLLILLVWSVAEQNLQRRFTFFIFVSYTKIIDCFSLSARLYKEIKHQHTIFSEITSNFFLIQIFFNLHSKFHTYSFSSEKSMSILSRF